MSVTEDRREYRPQMLLADEGQVTRAECTCTIFRKQGLKAGPCVHLVALRLAYAEQEARRLKGLDPKQAITVETRTYSRATRPARRSTRSRSSGSGSRSAGAGPASPVRLQTLDVRHRGGAAGAFLAGPPSWRPGDSLDCRAGRGIPRLRSG